MSRGNIYDHIRLRGEDGKDVELPFLEIDEELWDTTMNPETRTILQVSVQDNVEADIWFDKLMGDAVPPRREYIMAHATNVKNLADQKASGITKNSSTSQIWMSCGMRLPIRSKASTPRQMNRSARMAGKNNVCHGRKGKRVGYRV